MAFSGGKLSINAGALGPECRCLQTPRLECTPELLAVGEVAGVALVAAVDLTEVEVGA